MWAALRILPTLQRIRERNNEQGSQYQKPITLFNESKPKATRGIVAVDVRFVIYQVISRWRGLD
jgi:hypothetical protein